MLARIRHTLAPAGPARLHNPPARLRSPAARKTRKARS